MRIRIKKKPTIGLGVALLVILLLGILIYLPVMRIKAKAKVLVASAQIMKADIKKNDIDLLQKDMDDVETKYKDFEKEAKSVYWMRFIPYVSDFKNGVEAGDYMIKAGQESIKAITPYADLIGFKKGEPGIKGQSADDRLATAVITLDKLTGKIEPISDDIEQAELRLNKINPDRYPKKFGKTEVRAQIINLKTQFDGLKSLFVDAKPLLKNLPEMLGANEEKTYLVLYENEMEQRPNWGFLTYYAVFKVNKGRMKVETSQDIYSLDNSISNHPAAPRLISTYHINVPKFNIRDSNLSPDFVESMNLFNSLYEKSNEKVKYDGVVAVDSKILVDLLRIYGPQTVDEINFSADTNKACDCADVIYKLFDLVDRPTPYLRENRKAILGDLMQQLMRNVFGRGSLLGTFSQSMFKNLDEKHTVLYFTDPSMQKSVESLNYAGRIRPFEGDYLHVNNANFAGAKSNLFVVKTLSSKTTISGDSVQREVKVEMKNDHPASDCNLERAGLCLNAKLRNLMRVYVPKGSKLISFRGSLTKAQTYDELDKTVFEGFTSVDPMGKSSAVITYTLPSTVDAKNYKLLIQKQPGEETEKLNVTVNGAVKYDGMFDKDKTVTNL